MSGLHRGSLHRSHLKMEDKCLYCYSKIDQDELGTPAGIHGFHRRCSKKFFGTDVPPKLEFTQDEILEFAEHVIKSQRSVTGVQPKLSLGLSTDNEMPERFTIVGLWGQYILKPQTETYTDLPEIEDLTMHLAAISKIETVDHSLIRIGSGELAYITKRIDRKNGVKSHMEDMCQLTERLTEHKYKGSHEQVAKAIKKYSANPGLDLVNFYELVLFCFLTGNNDMHLKNFSLLKAGSEYSLCPAYDLVASELVVENDDEDLALNLNGKKKKIKKQDFEIAMKGSGLDEKVIENIFKKFGKLVYTWSDVIDNGFLTEQVNKEYKELIKLKADQVGIGPLEQK